MIAIEDVHWADASTIALTGELSSMCLRASVLLYLIARPEGDSVLGEIAAERTTIRLESLGESGVDALIESILESSSPAGLASFVARRTAGNPFFVEELLRSLRETNALVRENGSWTMRPGWDARTLPETIEEVLSARIDLLPRTAASALQTASVVGRRVPLPLLEEVATDVPDLSGAVDHLVASAFLDHIQGEGERALSFHHALVQDTAYSRILRRRRRDLHRKVAEVAEGLYGAGDNAIDLLARHLYLGEAGPKAFDYLVRAGERAKRLFANEEAILHLQRAAEVAESDTAMSDRLPEIQLSIADLYELVGAYEAAYGRAGNDKLALMMVVARVQEEELAEPDKALATNTEILKLDENNPQAIAALERLYLRTERYNDLLGIYEKKLRLEGDAAAKKDIRYKVASIFEMEVKDNQRAIAAYQDILKDAGDELPAYRALDRIYVATQEWQNLASVIRRELSLVPPGDKDAVVELKFRLGSSLESYLNDPKGAIDQFRDILQLAPDHGGYREAANSLLLGYDDAWVVDQRLELAWREIVMKKKPDQTARPGGVQVFELTMDNTEDQDALNRRLRKPGEPGPHLPAQVAPTANSESTTESTGKKKRRRKGTSSVSLAVQRPSLTGRRPT